MAHVTLEDRLYDFDLKQSYGVSRQTLYRALKNSSEEER